MERGLFSSHLTSNSSSAINQRITVKGQNASSKEGTNEKTTHSIPHGHLFDPASLFCYQLPTIG
jgi:hypothetical protein